LSPQQTRAPAADVNISIKGGERIELKNINSLRKINDAIEIEPDLMEAYSKLAEKHKPKLI